jgi:hypothetical protein
MQRILDLARELERDLHDQFAAASVCHDKCEQRVQQLQKGLDSHLIEHWDEEQVYRLREFAASVRVKHGLLIKQIGQVQRLADECDEMMTVAQTASRLKDDATYQKAKDRMAECLEQVKDVHERSVVVCDLLQDLEQNQLSLFERMRR